jgi:hypothetical protein
MGISKRLSEKKELFTLSDLNDFVNQAYQSRIPRNAIVRGKISWRGRITELWISDAELDMTFKDQMEELDQTPLPVGPGRIFSPDPEEVKAQDLVDDYDKRDRERGYYVPRQQLTDGGPMHGGFTVVEGKDPE